MRRKKEVSAERNINFQQCLMTLKGQYLTNYKKIVLQNLVFFSNYIENLTSYFYKHRNLFENF
jgi:hypothetical protein